MGKEVYKVKEGHDEQLVDDMVLARDFCKNLNISEMTKIIMDNGLDRWLVLGVKRRRIRKKRIKQLIRDVRGDVIRRVFKHFIGFDDEGYIIEG